MAKLEVFFDYICPFCLKGHEYLRDLYASYPNIEIIWCPCEAHTKPEVRNRYSDLCIQAMYFALDNGVDIWAFHDRMYQAALVERIDINSADALSQALHDLLDANALKAALQNGDYSKRQLDGNRYAYEKNGIEAVPSYRMGDGELNSIIGVGITKDQLKEFLDKAK